MSKIMSKLSVLFIIVLCAFFVGCKEKDNNHSNNETMRDDTKWFSEEELAKKGLSGLLAPTGLTGEMSTSDFWFNDGYSFNQLCPSEEVFFKNAEKYFNYFEEHYNGLFGTISIEKISLEENENWYKITPKTNLEDYFDDNPSKLYKFYYVTNTTLEDGYLQRDSVYTFEIRYEFNTSKDAYSFKIFIENAGTTRNGIYTNYYKLNK